MIIHILLWLRQRKGCRKIAAAAVFTGLVDLFTGHFVLVMWWAVVALMFILLSWVIGE